MSASYPNLGPPAAESFRDSLKALGQYVAIGDPAFDSPLMIAADLSWLVVTENPWSARDNLMVHPGDLERAEREGWIV